MVEVVFYISILTLVLSLSLGAIFSLTRSYQRLQSAWVIGSSATAAFERITRETRNASSFNLSQSIFDISPGQLTLNTTSESGATTTIQFFLDQETLRVKEAGVDVGPLTLTKVRVTNLVFRSITGAKSRAIKIEMTLESGQGLSLESKNFYSTVVMRGSYPL